MLNSLLNILYSHNDNHKEDSFFKRNIDIHRYIVIFIKIAKRLFFKTNDVFISKYIILYRYSEKIFKSICIFTIFSTQLLFVNTKHICNSKEN